MVNNDSPIEGADENDISHDGYYTIALSDAGVYLMVHPPEANGTPVKDSTIIIDLKNRDIDEYQYPLIIKTVREATGIPVKIAEAPLSAGNPDIHVLVTRDRMEASLHIFLPQRCRPLLIEEVFEKIRQSGVVCNLDEDAIHKAFQRPGITVVCAKGTPPQNGNDAKIKYFIDFATKGKPVEIEHGRVDFKNLNLFTTVKEGELIAEKLPPTPGISGLDVLGQIVHAKPGKDIPFPLGKNVLIKNNMQIVSALAGQLLLKNNKIHVIPIIEVNGDVDLSTGNIHFSGNVIIHGSVQSGFSVKAEGDVEITGTVSGGTIEGNNVKIRMGIQGMQQGYIRAAVDLSTHFIENATVFAGRDVFVSDVILHSHVSAARKIVVNERRGLIIGGEVSAGEEIQAKIAGTSTASSTDLQVGVNPLQREEYAHLRKNLKIKQANLDQTQKALAILKSFDQAALTPEKREMSLRLTKTNFQLMGQVDTIQNRIREIEQSFMEMRNGRIRVSDTVHPGVKIVVGTLVKPIRETIRYVTFYSEDGEIKSGPYQ
ncbi:MAG: DUF342 domain-containing protein [Negativicutes bacterium]